MVGASRSLTWSFLLCATTSIYDTMINCVQTKSIYVLRPMRFTESSSSDTFASDPLFISGSTEAPHEASYKSLGTVNICTMIVFCCWAWQTVSVHENGSIRRGFCISAGKMGDMGRLFLCYGCFFFMLSATGAGLMRAGLPTAAKRLHGLSGGCLLFTNLDVVFMVLGISRGGYWEGCFFRAGLMGGSSRCGCLQACLIGLHL
jgi:hypothetical protein